MKKITIFIVLLVILLVPFSAKAIPICTGLDGNSCVNPTSTVAPAQTSTPTTTYSPTFVSNCQCPDVFSLQYQINNLLGRVANLETNNTNLNTEIIDLQARITKFEAGATVNGLDIRVSILEKKYTALQSFITTAFAQLLSAIQQFVK
jgi:hypothetical protein